MNWLNIRVHTLRSREIIAAPPAALGTWVRVLGYCCECENGGVISDAAGWNDRQWMTACGVTASEVAEAAPLLRKDGADVVVALYPEDKQQEVQEKRAKASENGKKGGRPRKDEQEKPTLVTSEKPTLVSEQKPMSLAGRKAEREREREREVELETEGKEKRKSPVGDVIDLAEEIYQAYPLKVGKPLAILKIKNALKEPAEGFSREEWPQSLLGITKRFAKAWEGGDAKFTPHPSTWFNQRRFEDDPETWRRDASAPAKPRGGPCPGDPCPITPLREFDFDNPGTIPGPPP